MHLILKESYYDVGYYARTEAIWQTLRNFIRITQNNCQIISLGAGLDTTFWRLHEASMLPKQYVEVDFLDIVTKKIRCIRFVVYLYAVSTL